MDPRRFVLAFKPAVYFATYINMKVSLLARQYVSGLSRNHSSTPRGVLNSIRVSHPSTYNRGLLVSSCLGLIREVAPTPD